MMTISTLLQVALALLLSVQNNPSVPIATRNQAISVANSAIQVATRALGGQASTQTQTNTLSVQPATQNLTASIPSNKVDVLSFLIKDNAFLPNGLASDDQSFYWHQVQSGNNFYLVKWNNPEQVVHYRYDNEKIYLVSDSTGAHPYKFSPGIWAHRSMKIGETLDMSGNSMQSLTPTCELSQSNRSWPYKITLEARYPEYNLGGDLGNKEVIVLKYEWGNNFDNIEREYYARGYGIVKWEHLENGVVKESVLTNKIFNYTPASPKPLCYDLNGTALITPPSIPQISTTQDGFGRHLYSCVLNNKNPEQSGIDYWLNNLKNKSLTVPQTYTYIYGYQSGVSNEDFVTSLYHCILFRAPDTDGHKYWLDILNNNQDTRANQVQYILNSSSFTSSILPQLQNLFP